MLDGNPSQARHIMHVQLFHKVATMLLDRSDTDAENRSHLAVAVTFDQQLEYFTFAQRQPFVSVECQVARLECIHEQFIHHCLGNFRAEVNVTLAGRMDSLQQILE